MRLLGSVVFLYMNCLHEGTVPCAHYDSDADYVVVDDMSITVPVTFANTF